ncbi:MAG TPA: YraN family protein [Actinomycetota bacterium]|nr:YraN family protein [Actinomycetota bacterium]
MHARTSFGHAAEDLAADHLERLGYQIVARNYRCAAGEIDVVAMRASLLVFCEVKARRDDRFGAPAEAVDRTKQLRLKRLAARWLADHRPGAVDIRFDVVSVIVRDGRCELTHIPDAF